MRADMFKVIVERPRKGKGRSRPLRARRNDHESPMFTGMRSGYGYLSLNENLAPLRRYLHAQVGRPWDKIHGEICAAIDSRSTVKQHVLQHIDDFVATKTWREGDEVWLSRKGWMSGPHRLCESRQDLYVDPRTGILRINKYRGTKAQHNRQRQLERQAAEAARRIVLNRTEQAQAIDGIWYCVTVARLPAARWSMATNGKAQRWIADSSHDVLRNAPVSVFNAREFRGREDLGNRWLFGADDLYAVQKRQMNHRELKSLGLR